MFSTRTFQMRKLLIYTLTDPLRDSEGSLSRPVVAAFDSSFDFGQLSGRYSHANYPRSLGHFTIPPLPGGVFNTPPGKDQL